jgi:hypothetical protein
MIASLSLAVTVRYLPRPAQQGSSPQIGVFAEDEVPAGNQQQQPLQSIHDETSESGWHTAVHDEASPPVVDVAPSVAPVDPSAGSFAPLSSLDEGEPVPLVLLQATSPTVDDAPMATMTWKSFSMFMTHDHTLVARNGNPPRRVQVGTRGRHPWLSYGSPRTG